MGSGSSRTNFSENKMVGTISNRILVMSEKERLKRRRIRLSQLTDNEKKIMVKYGRNWDAEYRSTFR
jgi:uncharacterized membrane protein